VYENTQNAQKNIKFLKPSTGRASYNISFFASQGGEDSPDALHLMLASRGISEKSDSSKY
jgi:hypothetical protein